MEKVRSCIRGYHTDNKDTKPESNEAAAENRLAARKKNKTDHIGRKEQTKTNKESDKTLQRHERVLDKEHPGQGGEEFLRLKLKTSLLETVKPVPNFSVGALYYTNTVVLMEEMTYLNLVIQLKF